jgi:capsular polysaccharide biosynthesis protein
MAVRLPAPLRPLWPLAKDAYTRGTRAVAPVTGQLSRLRDGYLPRRSVALVDESIASNGGRVWVARPEERTQREVAPGEPPGHPAFVRESIEVIPRVTVAELPRGRVLGPHRAVIDGAGTMINEYSRYFGTRSWREHPIFWHPFPEDPLEVDGLLGVLACRGDTSYYHFLIDVLPRLEAVRVAGAPSPERWYAPAQHGYQRELLELAGIPLNRVVDADLSPHVRAETLLVAGLPDADLKTPPWAVAFLRERLLDPVLRRVAGRRIYITRGRERNNRTVSNEHEVVAMLGDRGFDVIDPAELSVGEQIRTFAEAEWIVAPHGAGLANIVFCGPGASVVELFAPDYVQGCYWKLAACLEGVGYRYLVGAGKSPRSGQMRGVMSDITVDLAALTRTLEALPGDLPPATGRARS